LITKIINGNSHRVEVSVPGELMPDLLGPNDRNLRFLEEQFGVTIIAREASILLSEPLPQLQEVIQELVRLCKDKKYLDLKDVETIIRLRRLNSSAPGADNGGEVLLQNLQVTIKARTANQSNYLRAMRSNDLVFAIGPAGTGKTFLAVAYAVSLLEKGEVERIALVKPVVEAGEKLGFLPGDIKEKVDPYFRPLYDALLYMMPMDKVRKLMDQSVIEIAPLAYMRGRTLSYSIVILDEAQNTTAMQMKMFLTRMGVNSKAVVTGDVTQIDLEQKQNSGLLKIADILTGIKGVEFVYLTSEDVIRHRLVSDIIKAYDRHSSNSGD